MCNKNSNNSIVSFCKFKNRTIFQNFVSDKILGCIRYKIYLNNAKLIKESSFDEKFQVV